VSDVPDTILAVAYLLVSVESVAIQLVSLYRLRGQSDGPVGAHLRRTVLTRVIVMSVYVGVGVANLVHTLPVWVVLAVYTGAAIVWQINSLADARLARDRNGRNDHG
jgi:heme A synthase